ncbi:hypothetical protein ACTXT7_004651 [Hymenolepis weldensis]
MHMYANLANWTIQRMMSFTIQIKLSWSELLVLAKSSVLFGLHVVDIAVMRHGTQRCFDNIPSHAVGLASTFYCGDGLSTHGETSP